MTYPRCGPVELAVSKSGRRELTILAKMHGEEAGFLALKGRQVGGKRVMAVDYVWTAAPRCGIGTKLYERALQLACERRSLLASDDRRTDASEGFWRKQVRKKRAYCIDVAGEGERLYDDGEVIKTVGTWLCGRYAMREACPRRIDLSGRRRR